MVFEYTPAGLGVVNINLKASAGVQYASNIIDLSKHSNYGVSLIITNSGTTNAGVAKITAVSYDKTGLVQLSSTALLTAIDLTADRTEYVVFGKDFAAKKVGNGTIGSDIDILRVPGMTKFVVEISTASNAATSCVGNLRLIAK